MLKLLCVFAVYFAVVYASEKKAEITWGRVLKGKDYPGVTITSDENKTDIIWNEPVNEQINPLRATFFIRFTESKKSESADLDNLCGSFKKGSFDKRAQAFILNIIASVATCPIEKNAISTFTVPTIYTYMSDKNLCGPYRSEMKVYRKRDKGNAQPIIVGVFRGTVTGCDNS